MRKYYPFLITFIIVLIDQIVKIWVKLSMYFEEEISLFGSDWAIIKFTENRGMAFGLEFGGDYGKIALSLFRIIAVCFIAWYMLRLIKKQENKGFVVSISLILAGAIGNILDSAFYGLFFSASPPYTEIVAEFMPEGGGYAPFLMGSVVDMFYFPIFSGFLPEWIPVWGGEFFEFFKPIFNVSDASISVGVAIIFLFQRKFFSSRKHHHDTGQNDAEAQHEEIGETPPDESGKENDEPKTSQAFT